MNRHALFHAILAVMAVIAVTRISAAAAEPDPIAAIQAMTNGVARGNAWAKHIAAVAEKSFPKAEKLLEAAAGDLNGSQLADLYAKLAVHAVAQTADAERVKTLFNAITSVPDAAAQTDDQKQKFADFKTGRLCWAIAEMTRERTGDPGLAASLLQENRKLLTEDQIASLDVDFLIVAANECDREGFDRDLAVYLKQPMSGRKVEGLARIARAVKTLDNTLAESLLRDALASQEITSRQRLQLLTTLAEVASCRGDETESYRNWKPVQLEILALADKGEVPLRLNMLPFGKAYEYGDFVFADDLIRRALTVNASDSGVLLGAAQGAFLTNDLKTAAGHIETALRNERLSKDMRDYTEVLLFFAKGNPIAAFDREFADKKYTPEDKLRLLYRVSEFLFRCNRYERCREIHAEIINNMFTPFAKMEFTVKYDPRAPKTAEGWTHTPSYQDWKQMETRFVPHGDILDFSLENDISRLLKDAVQPQIPAGYQTGVYFLCNDEGLHIYVRADDPHVDEIVALKRKGGGFDMNFKAGAGNAPYNIWFKDLPDATGGYIVDWASPTKTYALARDIFKRDAVTTPEGLAAHVFVPWQYFCTQLPFDGNDWLFGMLRSVPGVGKQALTGNHQEFGRLMRLKFDLTPRQRIELKRRVANLTFNAYNRLRKDANEFILAWKDDALGDPAFFASVIEPMLKDLDEAGAKLTGEQALADPEVDDLFAKYVPVWGNIQYAIAEKRAAYLQEKLLK